MHRDRSTFLRVLVSTAALLLGGPLAAAPGDVLFSDGFERNQLAPWTTTNPSRSGILTGAAVSNGGTRGAFTRRNPVTVTSPTFNAAVPAASLSIWVRRGSDAFSEYPDNNEDLLLEYRRSDNSWGVIRSYPGGGPEGEIFNDSAPLPPDALHGSAAIRLRQTDGSGTDFDYYHFDDIVVTEIAPGGALTVGTCDDFSQGLSRNWTVQSFGGNAGTNGDTFQSPSLALFTNGAAVDVTTNAIDTTDPTFASVSMWIRRGADFFSENPDGNENFAVEYLDSSNAWIRLETFSGGGTPGQIFNRSYAIPAAGRHAGFRLRLRQLGGSGPNFDFWHVDDVCLDVRALPQLVVTKVASTLADPINGTTAPLAIPGAIVQYRITVENTGSGAIDADSVFIRDVLSDNVALLVDDSAGTAIRFLDGSPASGLSLDVATGVRFSNQPDGGAPYDYTPTPDADGFDAAITGIEVQFSGAMNGASGGGAPNFQLQLNVRVD